LQQHSFHRQGQNRIPCWLPHRGIQHKIKGIELFRGARRLPQFHSNCYFPTTPIYRRQCEGRQTGNIHL